MDDLPVEPKLPKQNRNKILNRLSNQRRDVTVSDIEEGVEAAAAVNDFDAEVGVESGAVVNDTDIKIGVVAGTEEESYIEADVWEQTSYGQKIESVRKQVGRPAIRSEGPMNVDKQKERKKQIISDRRRSEKEIKQIE